MAEISRYDALSKWTSSQWTSLLSRYYILNTPVIIRSKPSASLAASLEATEKARVAKQKEELGPEGVERVKKVLEDAKREHETPIPSEVLTGFPVPDVKSISWIPVQSARNDPKAAGGVTQSGELAKYIEKDGAELPFFVQFDNVKVRFLVFTKTIIRLVYLTVPCYLVRLCDYQRLRVHR